MFTFKIIARHSKSIKRLKPLWRQKSLCARPFKQFQWRPMTEIIVTRPICFKVKDADAYVTLKKFNIRDPVLCLLKTSSVFSMDKVGKGNKSGSQQHIITIELRIILG